MGLAVRVGSIRRYFAQSHECMLRTIIYYRIIFLASLLHILFDSRHVARNAKVFSAIETINRRGDLFEIGFVLQRGTVEHECRSDTWIMRCIGKGLASAPAETADR